MSIFQKEEILLNTHTNIQTNTHTNTHTHTHSYWSTHTNTQTSTNTFEKLCCLTGESTCSRDRHDSDRNHIHALFLSLIHTHTLFLSLPFTHTHTTERTQTEVWLSCSNQTITALPTLR